MADVLSVAPSTSIADTTPAVAGGGSVKPDTTTVSSPSLIVTSGASRSNYANNVTQLQKATSNLSTAPASPGSYKGVAIKPGSDGDIQAQIKAIDASQTTKTTSSPANTNTQTTNNSGTTTLPVPKLGDAVYDNTGKQVGTAQFNPNDGTPLKADGSSSSTDTSSSTVGDTTNADGTITHADGTSSSARDAIDPTLRNVFDTSMSSLDQGIATAKNNLQSALNTLQNDPAASAAVNMIMAKYDQQISLMKDKNRMLLGSDVTNAARNGSLQYANEMESNFMSEEQDKASQRVTDLITTETQMIMKAQAAYQKGDVAAFDAASKQLDAANKSKTDAIDKLLTQTDKIVKEKQAQAKITAVAVKQQTSDNIRNSTALGASVAATIKEMGLTGPQREAYIQGVAKAHGITDSTILDSATIKAEQTQSKADLSAANVKSEISKRNQPAKTKAAAASAGYKFKAADTTALYSAGNTKAAITQLQQDVANYGIQAVLDKGKMDDKTRSTLESIFGVKTTSSGGNSNSGAQPPVAPATDTSGGNY